ncbi:MAG: substrate-binding domain-containing protein [Planctomycetales bacterium]|nr:substrate-binding domain-containing protein [Planctomycetales bacterium]
MSLLFRCRVAVAFCFIALSLVMKANIRPIAAQDSPTPTNNDQASVEEISQLLKSMDPYCPTNEVEGKVQIMGSTSMDSLAHGWQQSFRLYHSRANVEISAAGSEDVFQRIVELPAAIAMVSRPVTTEELAALKKKGLRDPRAFEVAREALAVFVHSSNPLQAISGEQLRLVFTETGHAVSWAQLGLGESWSNQAVHVISRSENSGTQHYLREFVFGSTPMRASVSAHVSNAEVLDAISQDKLAIAICGIRSSGKAVKNLQLIAGNTVIPSDDHAILTGNYPLTRPFSLIVDIGATGPDAEAAKEFVRFALSQQGQTEAILTGVFPVDLPSLRHSTQSLNQSTTLR